MGRSVRKPRIVISRKGFDSTSGGKPSPIYEDKMFSIPIPRAESDTFYRDLMFDKSMTYMQLMQELNINQFSEAHLDPDLRKSVLNDRAKQWRPLFGQSGDAEGILRNYEIGPGDIFLFFGWFKEIKKDKNGSFMYKRNARHLHVIYGYMEVEEVFDVNTQHNQIPHWAQYHQHVAVRKYYMSKSNLNTLYVSNERFTYDDSLPGAGCFKLDDQLVLTDEGSDKRSIWKLPGFFDPNKFKIGKPVKSESHPDSLIMDIKGRGQEIYIDDSPQVLSWAISLIRNCQTFA